MKGVVSADGISLDEKLRAYLELVKPRVTTLVVFTAAAGYYLGSSGDTRLLVLFHALLGTALVSGGTAALNQVLEREQDGKMQRTCARPLPSGRVSARDALIFGGFLMSVGLLELTVLVNGLAAFLAVLTSVLYLFVYTPLKSRTPICTTIGAVPGAIPPIIGWAAARGSLDFDAFVLFAILFFWQFPHFLAISWAYREDYERGGFAMLSSVDPEGKRTGFQVLSYTAALLFVSILPWTAGLSGSIYLAGAVLLGGGLLWAGIRLAASRSVQSARSVLKASVVYLPLLLALMVLDKV